MDTSPHDRQGGKDAPPRVVLDSLLPQEIAEKAEHVGVGKARLDIIRLLTLAVLAGAFIALGAMLSTVVATGAAALPYGVGRLLVGVAFSLGLVLVVIGGAELFTGNNLMVMAWAGRKITTLELLRAWAIVYVGNFIGGVGTALLVFLAGQYGFHDGAVGATALGIATAKVALPFWQALFLGVLCNVLVCLAIWLSYSAHTVSGKILAIVFPITAFVAAGFEHSIANMYFLPYALFVKWGASDAFWAMLQAVPADVASLDVAAMVGNLVPVTIGNVIGGGVLVGLVYWFVYLRGR
ncbi:MAG: formate/nitrite transporter family protein [Alphaproteobacteria bacterium]